MSAGYIALPGEDFADLRLPHRISDFMLTDGRVRPSALHVLQDVRVLVQRMCPWSVLYAAPMVWSATTDGSDYLAVRRRDGGGAWGLIKGASVPGAILVSLFESGASILSTACHEAWHQCSRRMLPHVLSELDRDLSGAIQVGADDYCLSLEERRARAFEHWCSAFLNGCPPRPAGSRVDEIFQAVFSGALAAEVRAVEDA